MNIKISELKLNHLLSIDNCLIMLPIEKIGAFRNIKYEKRKRKKLITRKEVEEIYLTGCELIGYNNYHDIICKYDDFFIRHFIENYNLIGMRNSFLNIKKQIEKFGFKIIENDKPKE